MHISGKEHNVFFSMDYIIRGTIGGETKVSTAEIAVQVNIDFNSGPSQDMTKNTAFKLKTDSSKSDRDSFKCQICAKIFKTAEGLQVHADGHMGTLNHKFAECPRTFEGLYEINKQLVVRHNQKLRGKESTCHIKCPKCTMTFKGLNEVNRHAMAIHNKRFTALGGLDKSHNKNAKDVVVNKEVPEGDSQELQDGGVSTMDIKQEPNLQPFTFIDAQLESKGVGATSVRSSDKSLKKGSKRKTPASYKSPVQGEHRSEGLQDVTCKKVLKCFLMISSLPRLHLFKNTVS